MKLSPVCSLRLVVALLSVWVVKPSLCAEAHHHPSMETLGSVSFATSCSASVQPQFDRAVALMHSFQFGAAILGFESVLAADPTCAIADWGIALSSWGNPFAGTRSSAQLEQGLNAVDRGKAIGAGTDRERGYLDAVSRLYVDSAHRSPSARVLDYEQAMAAVSQAYQDDTEATIFYALALAADADPSDKTYANQLKAGSLLEALFAKYPQHPGLAHYIIHAYDVPALAPRAAEAARRYGAIAPSTPHALHMPSHTFTRIGNWDSSIKANLGSAAAAQAAHQPADVLHASDYMIYAYLQTAQDRAAAQLVDTSAKTFTEFDPDHLTGAAPASAAYFAHAAIPARFCLERQAWVDAGKLPITPSPFPWVNAITYFARGLGAAHAGDANTLQEAIEALLQIHDTLIDTKDDYWADQIAVEQQELVALQKLAEGQVNDALVALRHAADLEDKSESATVTPGPLKPARELLGEILLQTKQPSEALKEFQATLTREPNRFWSLYGAAEAAKQAGNRRQSRVYFRQLLGVAKHADKPPRPQLAEAGGPTA